MAQRCPCPRPVGLGCHLTLKGPCRWDLVKAPEVGVTLGSREARHPHEVITRGRQRVGVPQMARPCAAGREDGGGPQAKKRQELGVLGAPVATSPAHIW